MKQCKYTGQSFTGCPLRVTLPKIVVVDQLVNVNFGIDFMGKPKQLKYIVKECAISDVLGNTASVRPENKDNFSTTAMRTNQAVTIRANNILKEFTLVITLLTGDGDRVEVSYLHDKAGTISLKMVTVGEMTEEEKAWFFNMLIHAQEDHHDRGEHHKETEPPVVVEREDEEFVKALSSELRFLKNNGGKKVEIKYGK